MRIDKSGDVLSGLLSFKNVFHVEQSDGKTIRCIIPKGSLYFSGVVNGIPGFISEELIYSSIVKRNGTNNN